MEQTILLYACFARATQVWLAENDNTGGELNNVSVGSAVAQW